MSPNLYKECLDEMRIDILEVKTKRSIKEIVVIVIITLLLASLCLISFHYVKIYQIKLINNNQNDVFNKIESDNSVEIIEEEKKTLIPVYSANSKKEMKNIYNENTKIAYLTFDDGPSTAVTPLILDVLKQENIKATFFVLGINIRQNPDILKRIYLEGHYIANHGYSHNYKKIYTNAESVLEEYKKTEKEIQNAIDNKEYVSRLFRFPGGFEGGKYEKVKQQAAKLLNENDISYIDWNVLTGDAEGANTKEKILENIKKYTEDKGNIVVLMHDSSSKILTYETLKDVIEYLRTQGYTFDNFYSIMQ